MFDPKHAANAVKHTWIENRIEVNRSCNVFVTPAAGLDGNPEDLQRRMEMFGANVIPPKKPKKLFGVGVGSPAGHHSHYPGYGSHHFAWPFFLPSTQC